MKHPPAVYDAFDTVLESAGHLPNSLNYEAIDAAIAQYNALGVNGLAAKLVLSQQRTRELEEMLARLASESELFKKAADIISKSQARRIIESAEPT